MSTNGSRNNVFSISFKWNRGIGLVELLIALTLSVTVIAAVIQFFLSSKQISRTQESVARIQESGRHSMKTLSKDVRAARFIGEIQQYWNIVEAPNPRDLPGTITNECFNTDTLPYRWVAPMTTLVDHDGDSATLTVVAPSLAGADDSRGVFTGCIAAENHQANTDVLSVHSVGANPIDDDDLIRHRFYIKSDVFQAAVFRCHSNGNCQPHGTWDTGTVSIAELNAAVYYIRPCSSPGDDELCGTEDDRDQPNIPALVRTRLMGDGTVGTEVIAQGVENMQVQYGLDSSGSGFAEQYKNAGDIGDVGVTANWLEWQKVNTVRIWLLVRSSIAEPGFSDTRRYDMGNQRGDSAVQGDENYRYQMFTTTIALRNFAGL